MPNSIEFAKAYTNILDLVYQRASVSTVLNSPRNIARAGQNAKEIKVPKISVTGLGDYVRNQGYKTGAITLEYQTMTPNYDRGLRLLADVMDIAESGVQDAFVAAGSELQRTQVAPEADAFTFATIASTEGVYREEADMQNSSAEDILAKLRTATSRMDELQVTTGSRYLFITPTLNGALQDFSYANPTRSNRVLERFARIVEVPQVRFYTAIDLLSGDDDQFGYRRAEGEYVATQDTEVDEAKMYFTKSGDSYVPVSSPTKSGLSGYYELAGEGKEINFMIVEKSAVVKYDRHVASKIFRPDELEALDSYMLKYRKYALVSTFENKLDGIHVCTAA